MFFQEMAEKYTAEGIMEYWNDGIMMRDGQRRRQNSEYRRQHEIRGQMAPAEQFFGT
jgi:hypothetical protein